MGSLEFKKKRRERKERGKKAKTFCVGLGPKLKNNNPNILS